jgi:hypothetical protein
MNTALLETIENYLSGEIDRKQLEAFASINNISNLEDEIEWVKNAQLAIEADGLAAQLKEVLQSNSANLNKGKVIQLSGSKSKYTVFAIAASIVLLFGLLYIFKPSNTQQLYSKYEFVDPGLPVLMSHTHQYDLYDALTYYSEQDYDETITKLSALKEKNKGIYNDTLQFYLGAAQLYNGNPTESMTALSSVIEDNASAFKERAEWLYALANLKNGDIERCKTLLMLIVQNNEHAFYNEAIALQSELKK